MLMLDTANIEKTKQLARTGLFKGVTTNPTILARSGLDQDAIPGLYEEFAKLPFEKIFFQAIGYTVDEMLESGLEIAALGRNVTVKVPASRLGYEVVTELHRRDISTLLTAAYHPTQAMAAKELGCWGIAPYAGRLEDLGHDPVRTISTMVDILHGSGVHTFASLRSPDIVGVLGARGVTDFTMSVEIAEKIIDNPHTLAAVDAFMRDAESMAQHPSPRGRRTPMHHNR
ncbi:MAG: transaldolase family protein [Bowdeniella nasicola]|nr:transaldolase family protein [Bowdeniella nasicola]